MKKSMIILMCFIICFMHSTALFAQGTMSTLAFAPPEEPGPKPELAPAHHDPAHHDPAHRDPVHHEPTHHEPAHESVHHEPAHGPKP